MVEVLMGISQSALSDSNSSFAPEAKSGALKNAFVGGTASSVDPIAADNSEYSNVPVVRPVTSRRVSGSMHRHAAVAPTQEIPLFSQHQSMSDLIDYSQLAKQYMQQGRSKEAETLYIQALEVAERSLGEKHEALERQLDELSNFYITRAKYAQAEPLMERLLTIRFRTLVANDPLLIKTVDDLALIYEGNSKIRQSEAVYKFLMSRQEESFGRQSVCVAITTERLARCYCRQRDFRAAETLFEFALKVQESIFGAHSVELSPIMSDLASVYQELGKLDLSAEMIARQLCILEKVHGPDNLSVASCLLRLAELLTRVNLLEDAEPLYKRVVGIYQRAYGENTTQLRSVTSKLAQVQVEQNNARAAQQRQMRTTEHSIHPEHTLKPPYRAVSEVRDSVYGTHEMQIPTGAQCQSEPVRTQSQPQSRSQQEPSVVLPEFPTQRQAQPTRFEDECPAPPPQLASQLETARQAAVKTIQFSPTFCDSPIPQAPCLF